MKQPKNLAHTQAVPEKLRNLTTSAKFTFVKCKDVNTFHQRTYQGKCGICNVALNTAKVPKDDYKFKYSYQRRPLVQQQTCDSCGTWKEFKWPTTFGTKTFYKEEK